jgi:hypothetical protein
MSKENRGCSGCFFFAVSLPVTIFMILLVIGLVFFFVFKAEYGKWESVFESNKLSTDYVLIEGDASKAERDSIASKIEAFTKSEKDVEVIELSVRESLVMFGDELSNSLPENFTIYRMYSQTEKNDWYVFMQLKWGENVLPWVSIRIEKDDIETAQVYVSELLVGNINLDSFGLSQFRHSINEGISTALVLVNQNNFTGRRFSNIELEQEKVVLKGTL